MAWFKHSREHSVAQKKRSRFADLIEGATISTPIEQTPEEMEVNKAWNVYFEKNVPAREKQKATFVLFSDYQKRLASELRKANPDKKKVEYFSDKVRMFRKELRRFVIVPNKVE